LRIALIAAAKRADSGQLRAELRLGGRSILEWQGDLLHTLGCERIICLCEEPGDAVIALQRAVEAGGGDFHTVRSNHQLASLVRPEDDLIILCDGLLADRANVLEWAFSDGALRHGVATIDAGNALATKHPADLERLDRDRHWAGLAIMPGKSAAQLNELPADGDPMSLLLRLALQSRTPCREMNATPRNWPLATDGEVLSKHERAMVEAAGFVPSSYGPTRALAAAVVRKMAPSGIERGFEVSAGAASFLMLIGLVFSSFGLGVVAILLAASGAFAATLSEAWGTLRERLWSRPFSDKLRLALNLGLDGCIAVILILALNTDIRPDGHSASLAANIALPILSLGLLHLGGFGRMGRFAAFWSDRTLHLVVLAIAAGVGVLTEAIAVIGIAVLADLLLRGRSSSLGPES